MPVRRLIIRPGAIGDFIVSLPALESLRVAYTEVWTTERNVALARFADSARSITSAGLDRLGLLPADDVIARLKTFDSIVSWYGANRPEFRELTESLGLPIEFHAALPSAEQRIHAVDFYLMQAGAPPGAIPSIACYPKTRSNFAIIHPFASSPSKRWPLERFRELAGRLETRMPVQWCRGPEENLEGAVCLPNLYDLACWIASARIFIGNDSGITHIAAAVQTPTVAIFGPTDPAIWGPRGPVCIRANPDLEEISVDSVEEAIGWFA